MTRNFKVGYQIHPQHCTIDQIREAYRAADALGVDTIWVWDHMYPLYGDGGGNHYASTPILAAMAVETRSAHLGALVASNSYRNPEFYAYEVAAMDHLSSGRAILENSSGVLSTNLVLVMPSGMKMRCLMNSYSDCPEMTSMTRPSTSVEWP